MTSWSVSLVAALALGSTVLGGCGTSASPASADVDAAGDEQAPPSADGWGGATDAGEAADASDASLEALGEGAPGAVDAGDAWVDAGGTAADGGGEAGTMMSVYVTFYGWADNSPPGGAIAYPKNGGYPTLHDTAGGTGTYADPITFATDEAEFPVGTVLYVPFIEKYVIMEDDCVECDSDWTSSHKWHTDVWMNSNASESASALENCEDAWTRSSAVVEVNPPDGRTVTTSPLFDPSTNACRTSP
jgi:3D (Asp-Asp-Asp) domain-containing protein